MAEKHRVYTMCAERVYDCLIAKAVKKGRTREEVDEVVCWLTGYDREQLRAQFAKGVDYETFFVEAPQMNPARTLITGRVCGIRVEDVEDPMMREIRYLDKLIDELAKGRPMTKILRTADAAG